MPPWPRGWRLRRVCESLLVVDRMVGQLVEAQQERGRPAVFLFLSDNGMSWGQHGFSLKHTPPATHAPFYVAGTGIEPGTVDALVSKIDIAPTLAEAAGVALPWAAGTSFVPLLTGRPFGGAAELLEVMPASHGEGYQGWSAIRTPDYRLVRWDDGQRELYHLPTDPWQRDDLLAAEPEVAADLEARLDALLAGAAPARLPSAG
jgi:choline-sulfatase